MPRIKDENTKAAAVAQPGSPSIPSVGIVENRPPWDTWKHVERSASEDAVDTGTTNPFPLGSPEGDPTYQRKWNRVIHCFTVRQALEYFWLPVTKQNEQRVRVVGIDNLNRTIYEITFGKEGMHE
jgi:hypothetical protein